MANELEGRVTALESANRRLDERFDAIENLVGTAARFAERASESVDRVSRDLTHVRQDVQRNSSLMQRNGERLDAIEAGQRRLEAMVARILQRLEGSGE